jgi:hypothetical protein
VLSMYFFNCRAWKQSRTFTWSESRIQRDACGPWSRAPFCFS